MRYLLRRLRGLFGPRPIFQAIYDGAEINKMPTRGSREAAALDLYASRPIGISPRGTVIVPTGLKCDFLPGWAAFIWDRSGMGAQGLHRFAGVIDSDYRGLWGVVLHNSTSERVTINAGDRVAQVVFQRVWLGRPRRGKVRDNTERGKGGFGSTGK